MWREEAWKNLEKKTKKTKQTTKTANNELE